MEQEEKARKRIEQMEESRGTTKGNIADTMDEEWITVGGKKRKSKSQKANKDTQEKPKEVGKEINKRRTKKGPNFSKYCKRGRKKDTTVQ